MKTIFIMCLHGVRTGGPEAIHQLSEALLSQGFDARLVYYTWPEIAALEAASPGAGYRFVSRENEIDDYAHYRTIPANEVPNEPATIVVLPEPLCHLAPLFNRSTVLIWWLSVDNGFGSLSRVNLNHLRALNVAHATQSEYARRFVSAMQFSWAGELSDYTADMRLLAKPMEMADRPPRVAFNATSHKVTADLDAIISALPEAECVKIAGMNRGQIANLFSRARVYVDLGSFPGKDRMPREAMALGCHVITSSNGAGAEYPMTLKAPSDIAELAAMIRPLLTGRLPAPHQVRMTDERENFMAEAETLFYDLARTSAPILEEIA